MITAIETYTLAERFGDKKAIEMIKEAGFEAIDYSFYTEFGVLEGDFRKYAREIKEILDENGLVCNQAQNRRTLFSKWGKKFLRRYTSMMMIITTTDTGCPIPVK